MTINGLKNTIRYDEEVFRWALTLLQMPCICKALPKRKMHIFKVTHFFIMLANLVAAYFIFKLALTSTRLVDIALILAIMGGMYLLEMPYKNLTISLFEEFIGSILSAEDLQKKTLIQLSVQLEKEYGAAAIVDTLSGWTKLFRVIFMLAYIVIAKIALFLWGALILRTLSRSTILTSFVRKIR
jgi:hypothetical protein